MLSSKLCQTIFVCKLLFRLVSKTVLKVIKYGFESTFYGSKGDNIAYVVPEHGSSLSAGTAAALSPRRRVGSRADAAGALALA